MTDTVEDYLQVTAVTMRNQAAWNTLPELRSWIRACRLDTFGPTMAQVTKDDAPRREVLARLSGRHGAGAGEPAAPDGWAGCRCCEKAAAGSAA
jgi:hypothetical protein